MTFYTDFNSLTSSQMSVSLWYKNLLKMHFTKRNVIRIELYFVDKVLV